MKTIYKKTTKNIKLPIKNIFVSFLIPVLLFSACSSKVQTNKLPDEKKFILPQNTNSKQELTISTQIKRDFEQSLKAFFKVKDKEQESIYDVGLKRGHFAGKEN